MAVLRAVWTVLAAVAVVGVVASCAAAPVATDPGDWVVVTFDGTDQEFDAGIMDALLETEVAADEALQSADAGWIETTMWIPAPAEPSNRRSLASHA